MGSDMDVTVRFAWSNDGAYATVHFCIYDSGDPRTPIDPDRDEVDFDVIYLYCATAQTLREVTQSRALGLPDRA